jgi:hypothetical protein
MKEDTGTMSFADLRTRLPSNASRSFASVVNFIKKRPSGT